MGPTRPGMLLRKTACKYTMIHPKGHKDLWKMKVVFLSSKCTWNNLWIYEIWMWWIPMYYINIMRVVGHTVDGKNLHHLICSLSHYLQGFIHPRWCRISSINSIIPHLGTTLKEWKRIILAVIWIDRLTRIYPACKIETFVWTILELVKKDSQDGPHHHI